MSSQEKTGEDQPLLQVAPKKRTIFFIIMYLLFVIDFISRVGINSIFPVIQEDLNLTDMQVGMMGSAILFGMALLVLPVSFLGEKYSPKKAITLSAAVWSIGTLFSGLANNFSLLLMSRFMVGAGNSAYAPLSNSLLTSMYAKSQWGKKIGIYNTAMTLGMALGAIVFANLADQFGWRMAFYTVGVVSLVLTLASLTLPDSKKIEKTTQSHAEKQEKDKVNLKDAFSAIIKNKSLIGICFCAALASMVVQGILSWVSIFFVREMGYSVSAAASFISIMALVAAFGYPLGGAVMDKWCEYDRRGRVYLPAICLVIAAISLFSGFALKSIVLICLGMFMTTTANTCYHVCTQELVPSWFKSVSYGIYVVFIQFFGACGPLCIGTLSQTIGLEKALISMQGFLVVTVVLFVLIGRIYMKDFQRARALEANAEQDTTAA